MGEKYKIVCPYLDIPKITSRCTKLGQTAESTFSYSQAYCFLCQMTGSIFLQSWLTDNLGGCMTSVRHQDDRL